MTPLTGMFFCFLFILSQARPIFPQSGLRAVPPSLPNNPRHFIHHINTNEGNRNYTLAYDVKIHSTVISLKNELWIETVHCLNESLLQLNLKQNSTQYQSWKIGDILSGGSEWGCLSGGKPASFRKKIKSIVVQGSTTLLVEVQSAHIGDCFESANINFSAKRKTERREGLHHSENSHLLSKSTNHFLTQSENYPSAQPGNLAKFELQENIYFLSISDNMVLRPDTWYSITWTPVQASLNIDYAINGGNWIPFYTNLSPGRSSVSIKLSSSGHYDFRIYDPESYSVFWLGYETEDEVSNILVQPDVSLDGIISPSSNSRWGSGSWHEILWRYSGTQTNLATVTISLYCGSLSFARTIATSVPLSIGSYVWRVQNCGTTNEDGAYIRITVDQTNQVYESHYFHINQMDVTEPTSLDIFAPSDVVQIRWSPYDNETLVTIDLYRAIPSAFDAWFDSILVRNVGFASFFLPSNTTSFYPYYFTLSISGDVWGESEPFYIPGVEHYDYNYNHQFGNASSVIAIWEENCSDFECSSELSSDLCNLCSTYEIDMGITCENCWAHSSFSDTNFELILGSNVVNRFAFSGTANITINLDMLAKLQVSRSWSGRKHLITIPIEGVSFTIADYEFSFGIILSLNFIYGGEFQASGTIQAGLLMNLQIDIDYVYDPIQGGSRSLATVSPTIDYHDQRINIQATASLDAALETLLEFTFFDQFSAALSTEGYATLEGSFQYPPFSPIQSYDPYGTSHYHIGNCGVPHWLRASLIAGVRNTELSLSVPLVNWSYAYSLPELSIVTPIASGCFLETSTSSISSLLISFTQINVSRTLFQFELVQEISLIFVTYNLSVSQSRIVVIPRLYTFSPYANVSIIDSNFPGEATSHDALWRLLDAINNHVFTGYLTYSIASADLYSSNLELSPAVKQTFSNSKFSAPPIVWVLCSLAAGIILLACCDFLVRRRKKGPVIADISSERVEPRTDIPSHLVVNSESTPHAEQYATVEMQISSAGILPTDSGSTGLPHTEQSQDIPTQVSPAVEPTSAASIFVLEGHISTSDERFP